MVFVSLAFYMILSFVLDVQTESSIFYYRPTDKQTSEEQKIWKMLFHDCDAF